LQLPSRFICARFLAIVLLRDADSASLMRIRSAIRT